jgi:rhodanese-related sulfurtransferase
LRNIFFLPILSALVFLFLCNNLAFAAMKLGKRNPELAISAESVLQKLKEKREIILIDVRNSKKFEKFRIPGSINIPLFAIKTKTFLKSKPLVLINEGYSYSQLEQECMILRNSGFKASILDGGIYYWK